MYYEFSLSDKGGESSVTCLTSLVVLPAVQAFFK